MIYIIDDKRSRQRDYGWDDNKISEFANIVVPIYNLEDLLMNKDAMFMNDNIILFHESFLAYNVNKNIEEIELFKKALEDYSNNLYVVYFSGSKNNRYVEERLCMLPPDVMYANLNLFINKMKDGDVNLNYLAFGLNYNIEEKIRNKLEIINIQNVSGNKVNVNNDVFFAITKEDTVEPPFDNIIQTKDWDFFDENLCDEDLENFINNYLINKQYYAIYIPLYFGNVYSDYLGLRLAAHIRLTQSLNTNTPIFIYGVSSHEDVIKNECYDILKTSNVYLINADNESFIKSLNQIESKELDKYNIDNFNLKIPSNIGDNHSLANRWAIYRWIDMLDWKNKVVFQNTEITKSLYFKYLVAKYGVRDKFKKEKYDIGFEGINGKTIVYIDDEYDKGWEQILRTIFENNDARFICFKEFDKKLSKQALIEKIKVFVAENDADCYILDLRLHEDDFGERKNLSGHDISSFIKDKNEGNQIVVFSASNKIWNLKEQIDEIGATAYALKESPDLNLKRNDSKRLYIDFINAVKQACSMSYLKDIVNKQEELKSHFPSTAQLDSIINLLSRDAGKNDQDLLGAALLTELVFIEDLIKNQLDYELIEDKGKIFYRQNMDTPHIISGHLFFKSEIVDGHKVVKEYDFKEEISLRENDWDDAIKRDISLVVAVLIMEFQMPNTLIQKFIDFKFIRNTQIAHGSKRKNKLTEDVIVDCYYNVVCPIVMKLIKDKK